MTQRTYPPASPVGREKPLPVAPSPVDIARKALNVGVNGLWARRMFERTMDVRSMVALRCVALRCFLFFAFPLGLDCLNRSWRWMR